MTAQDVLLWGAILGAIGRIGSPLLASVFCTRPAPQWLRTVSDVSIGGIFLRLIAARVGDWPLDVPSALIYLAAGVLSLAVLGYHISRIFRRGGDRCR